MTGFLLALAAVATLVASTALVAHMTGGLVLMSHQHPHKNENEKERS